MIYAVVVPVLPGHDLKPCGMADRRGVAGVELHAGASQPVQMRSAMLGMAVAAQMIRPQGICYYEHYVWFFIIKTLPEILFLPISFICYLSTIFIF